MRILIMRGGAVGDFIVTLPVFSALRRHYPGSWIDVLGYPRVTAPALAAGLADSAFSLDGADASKLYATQPVSPTGMLYKIPQYDLILCYLHDPDGVVQANLERFGARRVIAHSPLVTSCHAVDHFLQPLRALGIHSTDTVPSLAALVQGSPAMAGANTVLIHPGSGGDGKNWPLPRFLELAHLLATRFEPAFVLGEVELDRLGRDLRVFAPFPVLSDLSLTELAVVIGGCRGYVGNDSGISHLAAAVGTHVVALFGPTDPALWAPRGRHVRVIAVPDLGQLQASTVFDMAQLGA